MFKALFSFTNNEYKTLLQIDGFDQHDFEDLKKFFAEVDATKNQVSVDKHQSLSICGILEAIKALVDFNDHCEEIANNIRQFKKSMISFNAFENELDFLKRANTIFENYDDVRKNLIETYDKFSSALKIFDDKEGAESLRNLNNICSKTDTITSVTTFITKEKLIKKVEDAFIDFTTAVTLNSFKLVMGDI